MEPTALTAILGSLAAHILRCNGDEAAVEARGQGIGTVGPDDRRPGLSPARPGSLSGP